MAASSFINTFTSGEISDDAWDRNDIQPITKGCMQATNMVIRIAGPLGKRRGFWDISGVADQGKMARLIPFRRSVSDALMLELGDFTCRVWQANGAPLMNGGAQVTFGTPWAHTDLAGLRFRQVADVIYVRHSTGLQPYAIVRQADSSWVINAESFPNGPWLPENANVGQSITVTCTTATQQSDTTVGVGAASINSDGQVTLTADGFTFDPGQVGAYFRLRHSAGAPSVKSWSTGYRPPFGAFCTSAGLTYQCQVVGTVALVDGVDEQVTTPPVQTAGNQSDGSNVWTYMNDGAGVVQILAVNAPNSATAQVMRPIPFGSTQQTTFWSEGAYSSFRGWPRMWPSLVEERLVDGGTTSNLDMMDMTETAGFDTVSEDFHPGLGNGSVVDTDAIRRRVGDDGSEILWSQVSTFVLMGTGSGEYIASGGLFGSPITPSSIVVRQLSDYGSADVFPAKAHKGLFFVTTGNQGLRKMGVDLQQTLSGDDVSFLAQHISARLFEQLAWVKWPDEILWARLGDGGLAALTDHDDQEVRGWTTQQLPGGFLVEDLAVLPGPGKLETLWAIVSRGQAGGQRHIWMMSQASDNLFIDGAQLYSGAPTSTLGGLGVYAGSTVRVLADGAMYDLLCSDAGTVTTPVPFSVAQAGLGYQTQFQSLTLDMGLIAQAMNLRQRPTQLVVHLKTTTALVGVAGGLMERVSARALKDIPGASSKPLITQTTVAFGASRNPTIVITEDTAYDHVIYSLKPMVAIGG